MLNTLDMLFTRLQLHITVKGSNELPAVQQVQEKPALPDEFKSQNYNCNIAIRSIARLKIITLS